MRSLKALGWGCCGRCFSRVVVAIFLGRQVLRSLACQVLGFCGLLAHIAHKVVQRAFGVFRVEVATGLQVNQVHAHDGHLRQQRTHHAVQHAKTCHQAPAIATGIQHACGVEAAATHTHSHAHQGIGVGHDGYAHACERSGGWHQACKQQHADQRQDDVEHHFHQHHFNEALAGNGNHIAQGCLDGQAAPQCRCHQRANDPDKGHQNSGKHQHQNRVGNEGNDTTNEWNLAQEVKDRRHDHVGDENHGHDQADEQKPGQAQQTGGCGCSERAHGLLFGLIHEHDAHARKAGHHHHKRQHHHDEGKNGRHLDSQQLTQPNGYASEQQSQKTQQQRAPLRQTFGSTGQRAKANISQRLNFFHVCPEGG